jgi:hypothetical protein
MEEPTIYQLHRSSGYDYVSLGHFSTLELARYAMRSVAKKLGDEVDTSDFEEDEGENGQVYSTNNDKVSYLIESIKLDTIIPENLFHEDGFQRYIGE